MTYIVKATPMRVPRGAIQSFGNVPLSIPRGAARSFGDDTTTPSSSSTTSFSDFVNSDNVKLASGALSVFHGYRRSNGSLVWAVLWGLFGHWKPEVAVPLALAQGLGRRKVWTTEAGPR